MIYPHILYMFWCFDPTVWGHWYARIARLAEEHDDNPRVGNTFVSLAELRNMLSKAKANENIASGVIDNINNIAAADLWSLLLK